MMLRSVSEDPVKMNESFLFSLATSAEPMQVTWKMNDERIIDPKTRLAEERNIDPKICILQMKESFTSRSFIYPKTQSGGERHVHLPDTDQISFIVHFPRDLHRLTTGS